MNATINVQPTLRLAFVGDICLAGGLQSTLVERGVVYPFAGLEDSIASADLVVGNFECSISDVSGTSERAPNSMIVSATLTAGLGKLGLHVVSLANNHTMDGGTSGLASTKGFLEREGILSFGAGADLEEAERPLLVDCKGVTLAFLGACDVRHFFATETRAGVAPLDARRLHRRIAECRSAADVVIVSLHADLEFTPYPSPARVRLSRSLAREGADIVVQHHPHVSQGIEVRDGRIIAYSLGNFVFRVHGNEYLEGRDGTDWGLILQVDIDAEVTPPRLSHSIVPVTINPYNQTEPSTEQRRVAQLSAVEGMSAALSDPQLLREQRIRRCVAEAKSTLYSLYYLGRRKGMWPMLSASLKILLSPYERRWMYSLLTRGWIG